jgi:hypothetical protein
MDWDALIQTIVDRMSNVDHARDVAAFRLACTWGQGAAGAEGVEMQEGGGDGGGGRDME